MDERTVEKRIMEAGGNVNTLVGKVYLPPSVIERHKKELDWISLTISQVFTEENLIRFKDYIKWGFANILQPFATKEILLKYSGMKKEDMEDKNFFENPYNWLRNFRDANPDLDWFLCRVCYNDFIDKSRSSDLIEMQGPSLSKDCISNKLWVKARVYWKDLVFIGRIDKSCVELIRPLKYV